MGGLLSIDEIPIPSVGGVGWGGFLGTSLIRAFFSAAEFALTRNLQGEAPPDQHWQSKRAHRAPRTPQVAQLLWEGCRMSLSTHTLGFPLQALLSADTTGQVLPPAAVGSARGLRKAGHPFQSPAVLEERPFGSR